MSNFGRKNFELAFITACRKNDVRAAYIIFEQASGMSVKTFVGGETTSAALLKRIVAAGQHAVAVDIPTSQAEANLELLFASLNVDENNAVRQHWNSLRQELHRLRDSLRAVCGIEGAPIAEWPKYWPAQDEQGGCVLCSAGSVSTPAQTVDEHEPQCGFRRAYEAVIGK